MWAEPELIDKADNMADEDGFNEQIEEAKQKASSMIIQAEKFHASVNAPPGKDDQTVEALQGLDIDDQFFHVTCHMDPGLKQKIEKGNSLILKSFYPRVETRCKVREN